MTEQRARKIVSPHIRRRSRMQWTAAAILAAFWLIRWQTSASPPRPVILPSRVESRGASPPAAPPVAALLAPGTGLDLSASERLRIQALAAAESQEEEPVLNRLSVDREQFNTFATRARSSGAGVPEILSAASPLSADSSELSRLHDRFWRRALPLLTPAQRRIAATNARRTENRIVRGDLRL